MKVTIKESEKKTPKSKYPYIGISDELIVLFVEPSTGIVLKGDNAWDIGEMSESWIESLFKPFEGEIILSNN